MKISDYGKREVKAARSVLVELVHILGEFRDSMYLIGGTVPPFLCPEAKEQHSGTLDVDIALNHLEIDANTYKTIRKLLIEGGYKDGKQPFQFFREVSQKNGGLITVEVDFLAGEYEGTGKSHRTQRIQDVNARKARGCDLVYNSFKELEVSAALPGGGIDRVKLKIASIVPFIVMKGFAIIDRKKEKDCYDLYYCLKHYTGGVEAVIREFRSFEGNNLVRESLRNIELKFRTIDDIGPKFVADFLDVSDTDERDIIKRDVFERVQYFLKSVDLK